MDWFVASVEYGLVLLARRARAREGSGCVRPAAVPCGRCIHARSRSTRHPRTTAPQRALASLRLSWFPPATSAVGQRVYPTRILPNKRPLGRGPRGWLTRAQSPREILRACRRGKRTAFPRAVACARRRPASILPDILTPLTGRARD